MREWSFYGYNFNTVLYFSGHKAHIGIQNIPDPLNPTLQTKEDLERILNPKVMDSNHPVSGTEEVEMDIPEVEETLKNGEDAIKDLPCLLYTSRCV